MREAYRFLLLLTGPSIPLDVDTLSDEELKKDFYTHRLDAEMLLAALFRTYHPENPDHEFLKNKIIGLIQLLQLYPHRGIYSEKDLNEALKLVTPPFELDREESGVLVNMSEATTIDSPFINPRNPNKTVTRLNQLRAFVERSDHAFFAWMVAAGESANRLDNRFYYFQKLLGVLTALLPFIRFMINAVSVGRYVNKKNVSEDEAVLNKSTLFLDQIRHHWPALSHDSVWTIVRLLSCIIFPDFAIPLTVGLFTFGLIKAGMLGILDARTFEAYERNLSAFSESERQVLIPAIQRSFKEKDFQNNTLLGIWAVYAFSAAMCLAGKITPTAIGATFIAINCIGHIIFEQRKKNTSKLTLDHVTKPKEPNPVSSSDDSALSLQTLPDVSQKPDDKEVEVRVVPAASDEERLSVNAFMTDQKQAETPAIPVVLSGPRVFSRYNSDRENPEPKSDAERTTSFSAI